MTGIGHLVLAASLAANAQAAPGPDDATRWQAMARADIAAAHARIREAHPGMIDPLNPGFAERVERGYREAQALLPHVVSYDTALAAVRHYTAGFEDGHLSYSDDIRRDFPILHAGWKVEPRGPDFVVSHTVEGGPGSLPPVGAIWTGCDGQAPDAVLTERVGPFVRRGTQAQARHSQVRMLPLRRPVPKDLVECTFTAPDGTTLRLPVVYRPISTGQLFSMVVARDRSARAANAFDVRDGVLWVRAGNFDLRENSTDLEALDAMIAGLQRVSAPDTIVFDARGNRGGDSGIGDRIFDAATGGLDFDQTDLDSLPRTFAQWRVSPYLVDYLDRGLRDVAGLYGADSPRVAHDRAFRDRVAAALARGEPWVEQDAGRRITRADVAARGGRLRRFDGQVVLLTDSDCVSACLDFADVVLRVPGVVHVGETTGADSLYMVGSRSRLPSGNGLALPVKVWRGRLRGNDESLVPDVPVDLRGTEGEVRTRVLRAVAEQPGATATSGFSYPSGGGSPMLPAAARRESGIRQKGTPPCTPSRPT